MMLSVLLLLPLVTCEIVVDIQATGSAATSRVRATGSITEVISDSEIRTFGITDNRLRDGAERHSGGRPQDVFVKSPTPWNDLYVSYNWEQVHRVLQPVKSEIIGIQSEPVIVSTFYLENNSSVEGTWHAKIEQSLEDSISSTWSRSHDLTLGQYIAYEVKMGFGSLSGETSMSFSNSWGSSKTESISKTVGSESSVSVLLQPRQQAQASLTATRGTMVIQVTYAATLRGFVACNYPRQYMGSHFWRYEINNVMNAINMPMRLESRETIRVGFYSNARVVLSNLSNSKVLLDMPVSDLTGKSTILKSDSEM